MRSVDKLRLFGQPILGPWRRTPVMQLMLRQLLQSRIWLRRLVFFPCGLTIPALGSGLKCMAAWKINFNNKIKCDLLDFVDHIWAFAAKLSFTHQ